jgi:uncharacterized phage protein gp47/JayE
LIAGVVPSGASSAVIDAKAVKTAAGAVTIYVLLTGGTLPNETFLTEMAAYFEAYRVFTDSLTLSAPTVVNYNVTLTYYIDSANASNEATIEAAVEAAVTEFTSWTKSKLDRDVIPDELISRIKAAGARRAVIAAPTYTTIAASAVAVVGTVSLTYGGLE